MPSRSNWKKIFKETRVLASPRLFVQLLNIGTTIAFDAACQHVRRLTYCNVLIIISLKVFSFFVRKNARNMYFRIRIFYVCGSPVENFKFKSGILLTKYIPDDEFVIRNRLYFTNIIILQAKLLVIC